MRSINLDPSGQGTQAARDTQSQSAVSPPLSMTGNSGAAIGTAGAGTTLTARQCRVTCRGKCGGIKPLVAITKAQKSRKLCHENCRASICNYISDAAYGDAS